MILSRRIRIQLVIFAVIAVVGMTVMALGYIKLPAMFGVDRYTVTVELPRAGGLYPNGNVTYRGTEVGKVTSVHLTHRGTVAAELSLKSGIAIPSNLDAEVHSQSAVGEQYVALFPRDASSPPLKDGSVIALQNSTVPPDIDTILDEANKGLQVIPRDNVKTVVDESYAAVGGLGPELSRIVKGGSALASHANANLDSLTKLIDGSAPVLDSQTGSADSIKAWASHLAQITASLRDNDASLAGVIDNGGPATEQAHQLIDRLAPSLPVLLANLVTVDKVAIAYQPDVEQLLVLVPHIVAISQAATVANQNTGQPYEGAALQDFSLNIFLPPPCTTGFLPPQQRRTPAQVDYPERPTGDLYCRVPQDSPFNVRGVRNIPCETVPGKRAPTVKMCESDEQYVPLNNGYNWKGDPNATLSGQAIPQLPPGAPPAASPASIPPPAAPPPLAVAEYDPATGNYVGPDGHLYNQSDLVDNDSKEKTWRDMLTPPNSH